MQLVMVAHASLIPVLRRLNQGDRVWAIQTHWISGLKQKPKGSEKREGIVKWPESSGSLEIFFNYEIGTFPSTTQ